MWVYSESFTGRPARIPTIPGIEIAWLGIEGPERKKIVGSKIRSIISNIPQYSQLKLNGWRKN